MKGLLLLISFSFSLIGFGQSLEGAHQAFNQAEYNEAYFIYKEAADQFIRDDKAKDYVQCNLKMAECKILLGQPDESRQLADNVKQYLTRYFPNDQILHGFSISAKSLS